MNNDIRKYCKSHGVALWEVGSALGKSESVFSRMLRASLSEEDKAQIFEAVDSIARQHEQEV